MNTKIKESSIAYVISSVHVQQSYATPKRPSQEQKIVLEFSLKIQECPFLSKSTNLAEQFKCDHIGRGQTVIHVQESQTKVDVHSVPSICQYRIKRKGELELNHIFERRSI